jgi:hypothetical protein
MMSGRDGCPRQPAKETIMPNLSRSDFRRWRKASLCQRQLALLKDINNRTEV